MDLDSPFLRPFDPTLPAVVTDGAIHVIAMVGVDRFSVRGLARWMRVTPSALLDHYSRARLLEIIALTFEARWLEWSAASMPDSTCPLRLPRTPDEFLGIRVRWALEQLTDAERIRGNPAAAFHLERLDQHERFLLHRRLEADGPECCPPSEDDVAATMALITGLRSGLAAVAPALTPSRAAAIAAAHLVAVTGHRPDCPARSAAS